ncbi:MAG: archease [Candidatus Nanohaloarchaeota archaeon QJJ-5]|nr:archease [Candidatus Nanohaloarchaeota archaeon QJJ-5]
MKTHEIHGHTSEVAFTAYGKTLAGAFEHAGVAMFDIMAETTDQEPDNTTTISCEATDHEALLYDFLDELIYRRDTEYMIYTSFDVTIEETGTGYRLEAIASGIPMDQIQTTLDVKAVTYSGMTIEHDNHWQVTVTLDV